MRKLATAAAAFSAAVFAAHYLVPDGFYIVCAAACALLSLSALFLKGPARTRALLICLSAAVGFSASWASYHYKTLPARELSGTELTVTAKATDYPVIRGDYSTVTVKLTGDNVPRLGAIIYSYGDELDGLRPGDIISADVTLKAADERYGEAFDRDNAENVFLRCYLKGDMYVVGRSGTSFLYFPKVFAKKMKDAAAKVFSADTLPLIKALLTGDKELLYEDTVLYADMSEAGILHVVAVSGMHVAFLISFIWLIVRRKRLAALISLPVIWLFVPFAGASPSVTRAAFMATMVILAPLLHRENDGVTALAAILAVLLLINPAACASVSLQLSFAAMVGIIYVTPRIYSPIHRKMCADFKGNGLHNKAIRKAFLGAGAAFSSTIGALVFTTPIAALYFGCVSLIGIFVNTLFFWVFSLLFIMGGVSCLLGLVWLPAGTAVGFFASLAAKLIIAVVKLAAAVPYAAVYTRGNIFGWWLILVYIIFMLCYVLRRKEGFRPAIPVCLSVISLCCVILVTEYGARYGGGSVTVVDVGQGQSIVFTDGDTTTVIDCGGKGKDVSAGDSVAGLLLGSGRDTVNVLLLTHFDEDHVNGVTRLMSRVNVKRLVIPDGSYDKPERAEILELAEKQGTEVYIIDSDAEVDSADMKIGVYTSFSQEDPSLIFLDSIGSFDTLVTGDAGTLQEDEFLANHTLPDAELYIAGHHGSKYSGSEELLEALRAEYAAVSCGYNSYGHPTREALSRMAAAGMVIFRTDKSGNITFKIDG